MEEDWDGQDRRNVQKWRVKREVSVGDLVAIILAFTAAFIAWSNVNTRVALLEQATVTQRDRDNAQDQDRMRYQARIDEALHAINRKLDRIIEGGPRATARNGE